ncbi:MAG: DUF4169 family protein [Asticcacaulis sp.]
MGTVVNLNKARKAKNRELRQTEAQNNRIIFGTPGQLRTQAKENEHLRLKRLEERRLSEKDKNENS